MPLRIREIRNTWLPNEFGFGELENPGCIPTELGARLVQNVIALNINAHVASDGGVAYLIEKWRSTARVRVRAALGRRECVSLTVGGVDKASESSIDRTTALTHLYSVLATGRNLAFRRGKNWNMQHKRYNFWCSMARRLAEHQPGWVQLAVVLASLVAQIATFRPTLNRTVDSQ